MALTSAQAAELASLNAALLQLRTGQLPSRITYNGEQTDFAKIDLNDLRARVDQLNGLALSPSPRQRTRGAIRFRL